MDWKIFFLLFVVLVIVVCEEDGDDNSDDSYYDEKKFHIQGRQVGDNPQCVVTRRRRSIQTQSNGKQLNDSPIVEADNQRFETPTGGSTGFTAETSPTGTGIISPTVTDTDYLTGSTGNARPSYTSIQIGTGTGSGDTSPTGYAPNDDENYNKIRDNKRISNSKDHSIEKIGTGIKVGTKTNTKTRTGTRTSTMTTTKTDAGSKDEPTINCIIVKRPPPPPAQTNSGIFGSLFNLRHHRSQRNIRRKFGLQLN